MNQESSNRDSNSSSTSSSSLVSPYHVTEVAAAGAGGHLRSPEVASPERVWLESLRQGGVPVPVPVPVPGSASSQGPSPSRVPAAGGSSSSSMRPTHSYQPLQRVNAGESSELKFAFDMELLKRTGEATGAEIDDVREST